MRETKTIGKSTPSGRYIEAEVSIGEYFSVVGVLYEKHGTWDGRAQKRNGRECDACGQITDELRKYFPKLAPIMDMHLADMSGRPMHTEANGWYLYSGKASAYEREQVTKGNDYGYSRLLETSDHERAASALNIDPADLPRGMSHDAFSEFVAGLTGTYADMANTALDVYNALNDGEGVEK